MVIESNEIIKSINVILDKNRFNSIPKSDIVFTIKKLGRYISNPSNLYWHIVCRILKYLKKIINYSINYSRYLFILEGYTDAS